MNAETRKMRITDNMTYEGPHGAYVSLTVESVFSDGVVLKFKSHRTTLKEGQSPGPLSVDACEAMMAAIDKTRAVLEAHKTDFPQGLESLALLLAAGKLANKELAKEELPDSQRKKK